VAPFDQAGLGFGFGTRTPPTLTEKGARLSSDPLSSVAPDPIISHRVEVYQDSAAPTAVPDLQSGRTRNRLVAMRGSRESDPRRTLER